MTGERCIARDLISMGTVKLEVAPSTTNTRLTAGGSRAVNESLAGILHGPLGYGVACSYKRYVESFDLAGNEVVLDYGSGSGRISRHKVERLLSGKGHASMFLKYGLRPYKKG